VSDRRTDGRTDGRMDGNCTRRLATANRLRVSIYLTQNILGCCSFALRMVGVADSLEIRPPHMCYPAECVHYKSNCRSIITEIRWKNLPPPLPGVPLFRVTQGHGNRHGLIGYLWPSVFY